MPTVGIPNRLRPVSARFGLSRRLRSCALGAVLALLAYRLPATTAEDACTARKAAPLASVGSHRDRAGHQLECHFSGSDQIDGQTIN